MVASVIITIRVAATLYSSAHGANVHNAASPPAGVPHIAARMPMAIANSVARTTKY